MELNDLDLRSLLKEPSGVELTKKGEAYAEKVLAEAGGVFFLTLSKDDRAGIAYTVERLINLLDDMDGDENLEHGADAEPWLGWTAVGNLGVKDDREDDGDDLEHGGDDEPWLGTTETINQLWRLDRAPGWLVEDGEPYLADARSDHEDDPARLDACECSVELMR